MSVSSADRPWLALLLNKFTVPLTPLLTGRLKAIEDAVSIHHILFLLGRVRLRPFSRFVLASPALALPFTHGMSPKHEITERRPLRSRPYIEDPVELLNWEWPDGLDEGMRKARFIIEAIPLKAPDTDDVGVQTLLCIPSDADADASDAQVSGPDIAFDRLASVLSPTPYFRRRFANMGYNVVLLSRNVQVLQRLSDSTNATGNVSQHTHSEISKAFDGIRKEWPGDSIRVSVWNAVDRIWSHFLDITEDQLHDTVPGNIFGPFAFARESISSFEEQELDDRGSRGTLIFTGATASLRGNVTTSAFSSVKCGVRAFSQSLAKEFGKQNIHMVISLPIECTGKDGNPDEILSPDPIAEARPEWPVCGARTYIIALILQSMNMDRPTEFSSRQHRSARTWELDWRPAHEKW
ncbi:hypothetical protein BS47DRAFT_1389016 [Hydnum rufescens UP504]|uniref:Uncharacterized protein n=1 Tax=Hydnum rufescens UP504 TaxID=1448309 RepID=A0A9P6B655_9AGAM|nr:hypothetical protein BS47DRAFT_1389016 [Hydnum rufescens UP504]